MKLTWVAVSISVVASLSLDSAYQPSLTRRDDQPAVNTAELGNGSANETATNNQTNQPTSNTPVFKDDKALGELQGLFKEKLSVILPKLKELALNKIHEFNETHPEFTKTVNDIAELVEGSKANDTQKLLNLSQSFTAENSTINQNVTSTPMNLTTNQNNTSSNFTTSELPTAEQNNTPTNLTTINPPTADRNNTATNITTSDQPGAVNLTASSESSSAAVAINSTVDPTSVGVAEHFQAELSPPQHKRSLRGTIKHLVHKLPMRALRDFLHS